MSETLDQFAARIRRLADGELVGTLRPVMVEHALRAEAAAKVKVTQVLHVRTGRLRASIGGRVDVEGPRLDLVLSAGGNRAGTAVRYAAIHERGGVIRPTAGKLLRIPLPGSLTGAGVDRNPGSLRGSPDYRFTRAADGRMYLVSTATGRPGYRLVPQVRIPARPYLRPSLESVRPGLRAAVHAAIERVVTRG